MSYRIEKDTMGEIKVPAGCLWGAQTQRSIENFKIGGERIPQEVIRAFVILKRSCALANHKLDNLEKEKCDYIVKACDEILNGGYEEEFPLVIWQTGSGTQSNMNSNEVIANLASKLAGHEVGSKFIHPNDDLNRSQSSNDTFPTAMHVAALTMLEDRLIPAIDTLLKTLEEKREAYKDVVKIGRTHLQDATPLTLGQEISGWAEMLKKSKRMVIESLEGLRELAIGGTAVGTGLNAHRDFGEKVATEISDLTGKTFISAPNKFHALTSHDALVFSHGALKALAANFFKIANDIRWLASGPRCGIGEISIPANEPGSSIMPGKINPTQSEAVTMLVSQVMGNDASIGFSASQGNFELNVFKPVIIHNFLQSVRLLSDGLLNFNSKCAVGIEPIAENIDKHLNESLMLVTALNPHIGYEKAAKIAKKAFEENKTLQEVTVELGYMDEKSFKEAVNPAKMVGPNC
ncbi:MAG: class II fumarate hydratase [Campylobacterales bacterium]